MPKNGTPHTPLSGSLFLAPSGQGARALTSWFYGDGPAVMTGIARIDPIFKTPGVTNSAPGSVGVRVTRWFSRRIGAELSIGYSTGPTHFDDATLTTLEAARAGFALAFNALFATVPATYINPVVTATTDLSNRGGQVRSTGGVVLALGGTRTVPYVTTGFGVVNRVAEPVHVTLTGRYQFQIPGGGALDQTNTVTMRYRTAARRSVGVIGAGVRRFLTSHSGVRIDLRETWEDADEALVLDNVQTSVPGTPGGFVEQDPSATNLRIVFSNTPAVRTSLSGTQQSGFQDV
jgi:hypothetical protein